MHETGSWGSLYEVFVDYLNKLLGFTYWVNRDEVSKSSI